MPVYPQVLCVASMVVTFILLLYILVCDKYLAQLNEAEFVEYYGGDVHFDNVVFTSQNINAVLSGICIIILLVLAYLLNASLLVVFAVVLLLFVAFLCLGTVRPAHSNSLLRPYMLIYSSLTKVCLFSFPTARARSSSLILSNNENSGRRAMLKEIIHFGNETVKDILTFHVDIVDIDYKMSFHEVLDIIALNKYSRMPVYSDTKDNIVGVLYIKDLLSHLGEPADFHWQSLIRPHICVPETKKIDNLLREFQSKKIHLSVVVDEYGGVTGVVTLEDIIEEIVGEINDEFDDDKNLYIKISRNTYIFDAKITILDFCKIFNVEDTFFEEVGDDTSTLARFVIDLIGDVPHKHQMVRYKQFVFEILNVDARHISKIKVSRL